jgi:hypothetical protein
MDFRLSLSYPKIFALTFCLLACARDLLDTLRIHAVECSHIAHGAHELLVTVSDIAVTAGWTADSSILTGSHGWGCMAVPRASDTHRFNADDSDAGNSAPEGSTVPVAAPFYYLIKVMIMFNATTCCHVLLYCASCSECELCK